LSAEGQRERLIRGTQIGEGDLISTESNGHVHLRFTDDALVSVRPNSRLKIQLYYFDPTDPDSSAVKLDLEEGVTRAISGGAAKAARNRFRLNTPIAAIGVRGTDFVVSADAVSTKAMVNEGAIIMAPFSSSCRSESIGPCISNALELTENSSKLVALDQNQSLPQLLPLQTVRSPDAMQEQVQLAITAARQPSAALSPVQSPEQEVNNQVLLEGVTTPSVNEEAKVAANTVAATDFLPIDPISVSDDGVVVEFDFTPPIALTSLGLSERQLVWGRYADSPLPTDQLALALGEAMATRSITVGSLDYGLFRNESGPRLLGPDLGLIGFQLTSAQAVFNSQTGITAMSVSGGSLDIDFQNSSFATSLNLNHELIGAVEFSASGILVDGGYMRAATATQKLSGAVSFDGLEAGYLFEKLLENGIISGLTLWGGI
jgi:hypothetical protein